VPLRHHGGRFAECIDPTGGPAVMAGGTPFNWHLAGELSDAHDNGDPLTGITLPIDLDPDGHTRPLPAGGARDIGADELVVAFKRGDADGDGAVSAIVDALFVLDWAFNNRPSPPCLDAADANDNGAVGALTDALFLLQWGFLGGPVPPAPGPDACGVDATEDGNACDLYDGCP